MKLVSYDHGVSRIGDANATRTRKPHPLDSPAHVTHEPRKKWLPLGILVGALVVWTALLALGAYLEWGADQPRRDIRKPLVMLASLAAFLAVWGVALWLRRRRLAKKSSPPPRDPGPKAAEP